MINTYSIRFDLHYISFLALSSDACAGVIIPKPTTPKPTTPKPTPPAPTTPSLAKCKGDHSSIGDFVCEDETNTAECNYDGGDCCGEGKEKWACTICKCLDPKFKGK